MAGDTQDTKQKKNGILISPILIGVFIGLALVTFLIVGLISGLVFRKICSDDVSSSNQGQGGTTIPPLSTTPSTPSTSESTTTTTTTTTTISSTATGTTSDGGTRTTPALTNRTTTTTMSVEAGIYDNPLLPTYYVPNNYDITMKLSYNPLRSQKEAKGTIEITGSVTIDFNLMTPIDQLLFHAARNVEILKPIRLVGPSETLTINTETQFYAPNEFYYIRLSKTIPTGNYKLSIDYKTTPLDLYGHSGIFEATYFEDSITKSVFATKFEALGARKAFPCFDEPRLKANFTLTLEHPLNTKAISSYPVQSSTNSNGMIRTLFRTTSKLSTHLFGWVIMPQDYGNKTISTFDGKQISVYARKNAVSSGLADYALGYAKNALDHIRDQYLNLGSIDALPPKIDLIALPDYSLKETSNLGLIMYREATLLFDDKEDAAVYQQVVAHQISNGIAAQWFGAYVTHAWWNELWLSKSISNFIGYKAIQAQYPAWSIQDQFITEDTLPAMWHDGFESSHPVVANVTVPDEIVNLFDVVTFKKGPAILRMIESIVGEANLKSALQNYLLRARNGVGNSNDFYNSLTLPNDMSTTNAKKFIESWLIQKNLPEVYINLARNSDGSSTVSFIQTRFLLSEFIEEEDPLFVSPLDYKWEIYLQCKAGGTYSSSSGVIQHITGTELEFNFFLSEERGNRRLDRQYTWVKCNKDFKGYYITDYSDSVFSALTSVLAQRPSTFSVSDRANLIHVSYELAFLGTKTYKTPAALSQYLRTNENDLVPWATFSYHIHKIAALLEHRSVYQELSAFGIYISSNAVAKTNIWDGTGTHVEKLWKNTMIELLCRLQDERCLLNATSYFESIPKSYFNSPNSVKNPLNPNIRLPVYRYHIQNTYDYIDWDNVFSVYRLTENPEEQLSALIGLSHSRSVWILSQYLDELLKSDSRIAREDFLLVLDTVSRHPAGRYKAWYFIRHFWSEIITRFSIHDPNLGRSIRIITETFEDEYLLIEMLDFFATQGLYGAGAGALEWSKREALDLVRNNILWVRDKEPDILNSLLVTVPVTTTTRITTTRTTTRTTGTATRTLPEITTRSTTTRDQSSIGANPRLPKHFIPLNYDLNIRVYFTPIDRLAIDTQKQGTGFDGVVSIRFNLTSVTDEIYLHADQDLNILDPIEITGNGVSITILNEQHRHVQNDYYYIRLNAPLQIGVYTIKMQFDANYAKFYGNAGIFSTTYYEDSRTKTVVSTKFEPTNARKGFPCFDEPQLKATFSLTLEHPLNTFSISNTPVKSVTSLNSSFVFDGGYVQTVFDTTPLLSTHQLAFLVAPDSFAMKSVMSFNNKMIRIYGRKNAINTGFGDWSLNYTRYALAYIESAYLSNSEAVPSKIDLIALPDFQSKEISHFGLISFRESNLLFHPDENSAVDKQRVAHSVSNGLAGLWFGSYVTCEWWSDLWMDKSVSIFVGNKAINSLYPEWKIDEQTIVENTIPVMWEDGYESSHPINANVTYPDEIINLYDSITFNKGPAILRMIESLVNPTNMQMALRNYLTKSRFSSGKPSEFYSQLQLPADMTSKTTPEQYISTWTKQMGYPELVLQLNRNVTTSKTIVTFEQARFILTEFGEDIPPIFTSPFGYRWEIYLQCRAGGTFNQNGDPTQHISGTDLYFTVFLNTVKQEKELDRAYTWVKCNQDFKGFYVTDYSDNVWQAFTAALDLVPSAFTTSDRANLIHNAYQLAFLDRSYKIPASLSSYMRVKEDEYVPWKALQWHIYRVSSIMEHRPVFQELSAFGLYLTSYKTNRNNLWDGQGTHLQLLWKNTMLDMNCRLQDEKCLLNATKYWSQIPQSYYDMPNTVKNPLNPNIRSVVFNYHVQNTYDYNDCFNIFNIYRYNENPSDAQSALHSLSYFRGTWGLSGLLQNLVIEPRVIRNQDYFSVISSVSRNPSGRYMAWYFLRHYWDDLVNRFSVHDIELHRAFVAVTETFEDNFLYEEMSDFFAQHPYAGAGAWLRQQARDVVKNNIVWVIDREFDIYTSLLLNVPQTTTTRITTTRTSTNTATRTTPSLTSRTTTTPVISSLWNDTRLPTTVIPSAYNLTVRVNFGATEKSDIDDVPGFYGQVVIDFIVQQPTTKLIFHADRALSLLDPFEIYTPNGGDTILIDEEFHQHIQNDFYYVDVNQLLQPGNYKMKIGFRGKFAQVYSNPGLFIATYVEDSLTKTIAATKFEPLGARKVFPCFDEPHLKANFTLTLEHPLNTKAISSYPVTGRVDNGPYLTTTFRTTSRLSTHLFGWVIMPQDYGNKTVSTFDGKQISVYARKNAVSSGLADYALGYAKNALDHIRDQYLNLGSIDALPPKIDLIALPDYSLKETSNLGLIMYREATLLFDDKEDAAVYQQVVAHQISNGIAAQWFGAYVTHAWWNELWLSKSISNFIGYKAIQAQYPAWSIQDQFINEDTIPSMWHDGFEASHPIDANVSVSDEIVNLYDIITFKKGPAIIRMLESVVGENNLRKAFEDYLLRSRNGVGNSADFYRSLVLPSEMSGKTTPEKFMNTWLKQKNYPEVAVTLSYVGGSTRVTFNQARFLQTEYDEESEPIYVSPYGYKWDIYLQCTAGGNAPDQHLSGLPINFNYFLNDSTGQFSIPDSRQYTWVKCNKDFKGYYITDYAPSVFNALNTVLNTNPSVFSAADRSNLIHISFELAFLGSKSYNTPFNLSQYLRNGENNFIPWATFNYHMHKIGRLLEHRGGFVELSAFGIYIAQDLSNKVDLWNMTGLTHVEKLWRMSMIELLCRLQDETCLKRASSLFSTIPSNYFTSPNTVKNTLDPNIRLPVYRYHIQNTYDYFDWDNVFSLYKLTENPEEQFNALLSLSYSRSTWILSQYLSELLKPDSAIRKEDFLIVIDSVSNHPAGRAKAWYFLRHYWIEIEAKFSIRDPNLGRTFRFVCETFEDEFLLNEMLDFMVVQGYYGLGAGAGEWSRRQAIDIVLNNIVWIVDKEPQIDENLLILTPQTTTTRITTTRTTTEPTVGEIYENIRLPKWISPNNYTLKLRTFFEPEGVNRADSTGFQGTMNIDFNLDKVSDEIIFHCYRDLEILDPIIITSSGESIIIQNELHKHVENDYYYIKLFRQLRAGQYNIELNFKGNYKSLFGNPGLFANSYNEDGKIKTLLATKFEPTDARRVFPCFDEPQIKAPFSITIEHPLNSIAISNFPVIDSVTLQNETFTANKTGFIRTRFQPTFKMSAYLAAWVVVPNDFGKKSTTTSDGRQINVYARKQAVNSGYIDFAVNVTKASLEYFQNYFKIDDAIPPKIDMIAIPDYVTGAMENWGLVGFRETRLLYLDGVNSVSAKQSVALTIAHEISHFWFGNLVTCSWWNDLWLQEAMASILEYKAIESIFPDWRIMDQFIVDDILGVMWDDGYVKSHPIEANVQTPDQITSVFDSITYSKGASVLRMLESVVTPAGFQAGLKNYLNANKFSSGVAADFYNSLVLPDDMKTETTPEKYMNTWIKQKNYPFVKIDLARNAGQTTITFEQARYLLAQTNVSDEASPYGYKWEIYLQCQAGGAYDPNGDESQHIQGNVTNFTFFLNTDKGSKILGGQFTWVKCNKDFSSFFVSDYSNEIFEGLIQVLNAKTELFTSSDRANLIHDMYMLAFNGEKSYEIPSELSNYLELKEVDYVPWKIFTWHLTKLAAVLEHRTSFSKLASFGTIIANSLTNKYDIFSNTGSQTEILLKSTILEFICRMQFEPALLNATNVFNNISNEYFDAPNNVTNPVSQNIRSSIYKYHIQNSYDYLDWVKLQQVYRASSDPQEQSLVLQALGASRSTWILSSYLDELLKSNSFIKAQDFFSVIIYISRNPSGRGVAWYYFRHNWDKIVAKFGLNNRSFGNSIKSITSTFETQFLYDDMLKFFNLKPEAGAGKQAREQAKEIVLTNIQWIKTREKDISDNLFPPDRI